jgi:hypothetical protein
VPDGGQFIDQVSIHAWTDAQGAAYGTIVWTYVGNSLPGNGGPGISGDPWMIRVDTLIVVDNRAYVSGIVTKAAQDPSALGLRFTFVVIDNGDGHSGLADELGAPGLDVTPILGGNLKVS